MVRARLPLVVTGPSCWPVRWSGHLSPGSPTGRPCFKMFKGIAAGGRFRYHLRQREHGALWLLKEVDLKVMAQDLERALRWASEIELRP